MNTFVRPLIILFLFIGPAAGVETPFLDSGSRDTPRNGQCNRGQIECGYRQNCQKFSESECIGCLQDYKLRLGFDDLVGGRLQALEFALATDALFSEDPMTRSKEKADYRLWSELKLTVECAGNTIRSFEAPQPSVAYGREGPLDSTGKLVAPITVEATPALPAASSVRIDYTIMADQMLSH